MFRLKSLTFITAILLSLGLNAAAVKVKSVHFKETAKQGKLFVELNKQLDELPELLVRDKMIQISVPGSFVWPKIEKSISIHREFDGTVTAYQFDKENVRVRTMLPYSIKPMEDKIALEVIGSKIVMTFPKNRNGLAKKVSLKRRKNKITKKSAYDESYLEKLLKDRPSDEDDDFAALMPTKSKAGNSQGTTSNVTAEDNVSLKMSATEKQSNDSFSMMNYIAKFAGFLALVLLLFYGVMMFLKKGAMKKGRLGFLNNTKIVEVISTTYVGAKKNLLLVRAHDQVFLVSNTDQGMNLIAEVSDVNGLIKEGEKRISGTNFDSELLDADKENKTFKTKELLHLAAGEGQENSDVEKMIEDKVKLSDQIKSKVKGLKSLQ